MTENNEKVEVKDVVEVEVKDNGLALVYYNYGNKDSPNSLTGVDYKDPIFGSSMNNALKEFAVKVLNDTLKENNY